MPTTMRPRASKGDILIIGGGASGLAAASVALSQGNSLRLLEAQPRLGKKLLATGNGRCNLMQAGQPLFFGQAGFAQAVLRHCSQQEVLAFFHALGLVTVEEPGGLVYPASNQAATVLDCLRLPLTQSNRCEISCDSMVTSIRPTATGFAAGTRQGDSYEARRLIVAAGSPAQPRLSGSDSIYPLLTQLGHRLVAPRPALSKLHCPPGAVRGLKGLRLPAICTLCEGDRPLCRTEGELLFTAEGISGLCAMQLSRDAGQILAKGGQPTVYLDFSPLLGLAPRRYQRSQPGMPGEGYRRVLTWLRQRTQSLTKEAVLLGALPRLLHERLRDLQLADCARMLSAFPLPITGVSGFDHAQVAAGGIDCRDVRPDTMESTLHPGLFLTGELLNVDGDCGGHNLLFAWASGILAGRAAAG